MSAVAAHSRRRPGWAALVLALLLGVMLAAALVSLSNVNHGVVRMMDLVREPTLCLALLLATVSALFGRSWRLVLALGFLAVAAIHAARIWPYVGIAPEQVALAGATERDGTCFTALSLNVKQANTHHARVARLIAERRPDVLLLMETHGSWAEALAPQLAAFPHVTRQVQDNHYGMIFASRLPVRSARMLEPTGEDTPTLYAALTTPGGGTFGFVGLHPRPPLPGQSSASRDASLQRAARIVPDGTADVLVMGDFNDVPWSRTTSGFRAAGGYRDPRIGRGTYPTFPASLVPLGWPLDQVLVKNGMRVAGFEILPDVGADHRPVFVRACLAR